MERDNFLAFKQTCEGLPEKMTAVKGQPKGLEKACKKMHDSLVACKAHIQEVKQSKLSLAEDYKASIEHMKRKLQTFSDDSNCGLKGVSLYQPDFPVELVFRSF